MELFWFSYGLIKPETYICFTHECSIAMGCIYTEAKNYPREPAAHVAISENLPYPFLSWFTWFFWCFWGMRNVWALQKFNFKLFDK